MDKKFSFLKKKGLLQNLMYTTKPAQAQGSRLPAMRHRSLNNFHKKWDNNKIFAAGLVVIGQRNPHY